MPRKNKSTKKKQVKKKVSKKSTYIKKPKKEVVERLVARRNIDKRKAEGWKLVKDNPEDEEKRIMGVRVHAKDLVLMSK